ncbi:pentapeptide repeat-containing protein [Kutzneria buriramensis]|uniref:Pentapeptide repeat protein n=1 Tax=Kutzneria buriramensis TaxID=1045776 RepID=A0A3E0GYQ6_9PSEU|nr:pentapeptide repeat-containing protein [Kutzneria buriramensis]REH35250.1 pentapeptide repeat protein [Kutzneria buriramensis]
MRLPLRWPVVVLVGVVLAVGGIVGAYWDRVDHASVDARHAAALAGLKSDDVQARIRAVDALESVTKESPADQPAVTAELASFIRSVAGSGNCPDTGVGRDVQEALNVLVRRKVMSDGTTVVDLHGACLNNAAMGKIGLPYGNLVGTSLVGAELMFSVLDGADLTGADLRGADLDNARLVQANLSHTDLSKANLAGADLNYSR